MKTMIISRSLISALIFFISFSVKGQYTKWEKDVKCNNIVFDKVRFIISDTDTTYIEGLLARKTIINGYPCYRNVVFKTGWKLQQFVLAENYYMLGSEFPQGTEVRFYNDKILCLLGIDAEIQGYCCNGNYSKWYSKGISTAFYLNGKLMCFYPCEDVEINNILCKSSSFAGVKLFENGKLKECKLAIDQKINGKEYKKNTTLILDETGAIISFD